MHFGYFVAIAVGVGVVATVAIPSSVLQSASTSVQAAADSVAQVKFNVADLNPLRAVFDWERQRIQAGESPDQLGFKTSKMTLAPFVMPAPAFNFNNGPYTGNGIYSGMAYQIHQNDQRMQDWRNYANNPAGWHGPPPH
jgi:hypothetical protein